MSKIVSVAIGICLMLGGLFGIAGGYLILLKRMLRDRDGNLPVILKAGGMRAISAGSAGRRAGISAARLPERIRKFILPTISDWMPPKIRCSESE